MGKGAGGHQGAIGFRVKTGRATAVLLGGPASSPLVLARRHVELCDPKVPHSRQPYHAELELPEKEGAIVVRRAVQSARQIARRAVRELAQELRQHGRDLRAIGLVVGSVVDPDKLGNAHIRAHALEGRLFREVLEAGAAAAGATCVLLIEREAYGKAATLLGRSPGQLKRVLAELGSTVGRPWASEEKAATLAAWVALTR